MCFVLDTSAEDDDCDLEDDPICRKFGVQYGSNEYNDLIVDFEFDQASDEESESSSSDSEKIQSDEKFFEIYSEESSSQSASDTSAVVTDPLEYTPATTNQPHRPHQASPASTAAPILSPTATTTHFSPKAATNHPHRPHQASLASSRTPNLSPTPKKYPYRPQQGVTRKLPPKS